MDWLRAVSVGVLVSTFLCLLTLNLVARSLSFHTGLSARNSAVFASQPIVSCSSPFLIVLTGISGSIFQLIDSGMFLSGDKGFWLRNLEVW